MRRSHLAIGLDYVAVAALLAILLIAVTGGGYTYVLGVRLSARDIERPILVLLAVAAARILIDRRTRPFGLDSAGWRRIGARIFSLDADPDPSARGTWHWPTTVGAAAGICAFGVLVLHPQLRQMDAVPDTGDPLLSVWRMGWVYQQLRGDPRPLFDGNIFHPDTLTLTYSDSMLLPGLTAAPLFALGMYPVWIYNVLFLSAFVLSAFAAYLLVERLTGSPAAAFVSALIFGFHPYRFEHYSHFELQMAHWMPLALLALHRFLATARLRYAIAAALCVAAQLYSSMYYAAFFTVYAAAVLAILVLFVPARRRDLVFPALVAAALAGVLALPLARPYMAAREIKGDRGLDAVEMFSAEPLDYLRAHERSAVYNARMVPGRKPERALFPGMLPLALTAVALVPPIGVSRLACAVGLAVAFDGSLGLNGMIYPYLYEYALPFRSLRVPARFSIIVGLSLAVLAGFGVRRLLAGVKGGRRSLLLAGLVVMAAVDVWPALKLEQVWREPPPIYGVLSGTPGVVLLEFPLNTDPAGFVDNTPFMYFSLWHWSEMVNGYSGHLPDRYWDFVTGMKGFPDPPTVDLIRTYGVTHVSVNCALPNRGCGDLIEALSKSPEFRMVSEAQWQGSPVRLYEFVR